MANFAKLKIYFTQNIDINDAVGGILLVVDTVNQVNMFSVCKASRTGIGTFEQGVSIQPTLENLKNAYLDDFIAGQDYPLLIYTEVNGGIEADILVLEATRFGVEFNINGLSIPAYAQETNTPEVGDPIGIDSVDVFEASVSPGANCKQQITLKFGEYGTPPYILHTPVGDFSGLTPPTLTYELQRSIGFDPTKNTFQIEDSANGLQIGSVGGLQYSSLLENVRAIFEVNDYLTGNITLTIQLQACELKDQDIVLSAALFNRDGTPLVPIEAYREVYNDRTGSQDTYVFENVPLQDYWLGLKDDYGYQVDDKIAIENPITDILGSEFVLIMKSNSLNFINQALINDPQNFTNRRYCEYKFRNLMHKPYFQKYIQTSNLWIQAQTNYTTIEAYLIDENGSSLDISSTITIVKATNGITWYKIKPIITSLDGIYEIKTVFKLSGVDDVVYYSEKFEVRLSYENVCFLKWYNDQYMYGYQDGIQWEEGEYQEMIIDGEIKYLDFGVDKTVQKDTNNRLINLKTDLSAIDKIIVYKIPYFMKERFTIALGHYKFFLNDTEYQTKDKIELDPYDGDLLYKGTVELQRVNYEIY